MKRIAKASTLQKFSSNRDDAIPDLVIGDATTRDWVLVEFEGAKRHQICSKHQHGEQYPDFSPQFRVGFFQLLDWVHCLKDARQEQTRLVHIFANVIASHIWLRSVSLNWRILSISSMIKASPSRPISWH